MVDDLDEEMRTISQAVQRGLPAAPRLPGNGVRHNAVPTTPATAYDFEELGERIAQSLLQTAREQLLQSENFMKEVEQFAEDMRSRISNKSRELADINARLKVFGASILAAHQAFHGGPENDPSKSS